MYHGLARITKVKQSFTQNMSTGKIYQKLKKSSVNEIFFNIIFRYIPLEY